MRSRKLSNYAHCDFSNLKTTEYNLVEHTCKEVYKGSMNGLDKVSHFSFVLILKHVSHGAVTVKSKGLPISVRSIQHKSGMRCCGCCCGR